jgi:transketolase
VFSYIVRVVAIELPEVQRLMTLATGDEKHAPSAHSTLDVLWVLYGAVLRHDPRRPDWDGRDRFLLSKGHGPIAFYALLAAHGYFAEEELTRFGTFDGILGNHPDRLRVPGVEISTGSLGHGLAMALGVALALRAREATEPRVFVLVGDGELNEGSNWEALAAAPQHALGSLTCIVVDNGSSTVRFPDLPASIGSLGWTVTACDGRDHGALEAALRVQGAAPTAVVARVRG